MSSTPRSTEVEVAKFSFRQAVVVALISAVAYLGVAFKGSGPVNMDAPNKEKVVLAAKLDQAQQKLCRVLAKTWRESVVVPQNWSSKLCEDYSKKLGGKFGGYQLGCISDTGTTLGGEDGTIPSPNCGWN